MTATSYGLIRPFNLDPSECSTMYDSKLPERLVMNLTVLIPSDKCDGSERCAYKDVHYELIRVAHDCTLNAGKFNIDSAMFDTLDYREEPTADLWSMSDLQMQWLYDGAYVQVSFLNPTSVGNLHDPECRGFLCMTIYDWNVCETNELDPSMHDPYFAGFELASNFELVVERIYADGAGVWTKNLLDFRNMVMIKARAVLAGRDPDVEYERFIKAGGSYFLEYPMLCP